MTRLALAIWALLRALPVHTTDVDEPPAERAGRFAIVAVAIDDAADHNLTRAARLVALGQAESRFARYVQDGRCSEGPPGQRCDPRSGTPLALGPWQQHRLACPAAWAEPMGSVSQLRASARCADALMRGAQLHCAQNPDPEAAAFAGYSGAGCFWSGAAKRAKSSRYMRLQLFRKFVEGSR